MNSSPSTSLSLLTCLCIVFSREEHKKHSSGCAFLSVKKQFEELTLSEFLKLDKERTKSKSCSASLVLNSQSLTNAA